MSLQILFCLQPPLQKGLRLHNILLLTFYVFILERTLMKFDRNVLRVNTHLLTESDI